MRDYKKTKRPSVHGHYGGFTLVEILVSLAILGIVIALASSVFFVGQQSWVKQRNSMGIIQNGQYALEQFIYDVRGGSTDSVALLNVTANGVDGVRFQTKNEAGGRYRYYWRGNGTCGNVTGIYRAYNCTNATFCANGDLLVGSIVNNSDGSSVFNITTTQAGPSPRCWHSMVYDDRNDEIIVFGGRNNTDFFNDIYIYNVLFKAWDTPVVNGTAPSRRAYHSAGLRRHEMGGGHSAAYVEIFGGNDNSNDFNDLYEYDIDNRQWTILTAAGAPAARSYHSSVFNDRSNTESIYFFGGNNTAGTRFNDTYQCQLKFSPSVTWSNQSSGGGSVPSSRYGHSTAIYAPTGSRQEMYVFGGNDGAYRNDLSYCNVKDSGSYNWTALNPSGKPSGRVYASSAFDDDNDNMYVFGGYNGAALGDFYVYAIDGNWATASLAGTPPTARYGHTSCYDGAGTIYLLGGRNITDYFNDFYAYDVSASTWTQLSLSSSGGMVSCSFTMRPHPNMNATAGNSNYTFSGQARGHDHGIK